jgi:ubiquinone/menaquinone biosynthesis C-methylase UbiE
VTSIANQDQYDAWNGESGARWVASADTRDRVLAPIGDALLEAAAPRAGESVLDVGCGCGATTLAAARLVGASGSATGLDLSGPMLDVARQRADRAGLANASFMQADAQTYRHDPPADLLISRFGTMFFADPIAAFTNLHRALGADGRMCLATWQPLEANQWLAVPGEVLRRYSDAPPADPGAPGMFAQSATGSVTATLRACGFDDISLDPLMLTLTFGATLDEAVGYLASSGPCRMVLEGLGDDARDRAVAAVRDALGDHVTATGVQLGAAVWLIRARRS